MDDVVGVEPVPVDDRLDWDEFEELFGLGGMDCLAIVVVVVTGPLISAFPLIKRRRDEPFGCKSNRSCGGECFLFVCLFDWNSSVLFRFIGKI